MKRIKEVLSDIMIVIILTVIITGSLLLADYLKTKNQEALGGSYMSNTQVLVGTSSDFKKLPAIYVSANSTTTDATYDGGIINQLVQTDGIEQILLCIQALGGTATSTLGVRQMGSFDNSTFFDVQATSTEDIVLSSATTTVSLEPKIPISFDAGTASTTGKCFPVDTYGYKYTRLMFWGEDVATDPNDGVQAWIQAILIDKTK